MKRRDMRWVLFFLLPLFLHGQLNYSGSLRPATMVRTSDHSEISLPFRLLEAEVGYTHGNFDLKTNSALEYRWSCGENKFQFREAYLTWFPSWGELKMGKQIHAWGAVDGNNPTDNLNPYDYYYMFLAGTDRKIGTLSAAVKYYWNNLQIEAVYIPDHEGNRFPFGEEDFPITMDDPGELVKKAKQDNEYGLRLQMVIGNSDVGLSYFTGNDRGFTHSGYNSGWEMVFPIFFYRKTDVLGFDIVSFIGDATGRIEAGYYKTENDYETDFSILRDASYLQYAVQLEYTTSNDMMITGQIIGSEILEVNGTSYIFGPLGILTETYPTTKDEFQPGMGTPFAMFTDLGLMLSVTGNYWDNALEIRGNTFWDLKDNQSMLGGGVSYSPIENWDLELSITHFFGEEGTRFKEMEEFSHIRLGLGYHF